MEKRPTVKRAIALSKDQIDPNPWNPNKMTERQNEALQESLSIYGQLAEIIVRPHPVEPEKYQIIDGEHRLSEFNNDEVWVNVIEGLSETQAKKLTITLNETRGKADKIELANLLSDLDQEVEELKQGLPYSSSELEELLDISQVNWEEFSEDFQQESSQQEEDEDSGFVTLTAKLREEDMVRLRESYNAIAQEIELPSADDLAWGEVLLKLAKQYEETSAG